MAKEIKFNMEARSLMKEGVDALANVLRDAMWLSTRNSVLLRSPRTVLP